MVENTACQGHSDHSGRAKRIPIIRTAKRIQTIQTVQTIRTVPKEFRPFRPRQGSSDHSDHAKRIQTFPTQTRYLTEVGVSRLADSGKRFLLHERLRISQPTALVKKLPKMTRSNVHILILFITDFVLARHYVPALAMQAFGWVLLLALLVL